MTKRDRSTSRIKLRGQLTLSYAAVGVAILLICLGTTHWIHRRDDRLDDDRAQAVEIAQELRATVDSAFEESLTYVLMGGATEKENALLRLARLASGEHGLRANAFGANVARTGPELGRMERATAAALLRTHGLFEDYERGEWRADGESFVRFEESMDFLSDRADDLLGVIRRRAAEDVAASRRLLNWTMTAIGLIGVLLATLMGDLLGRRIVRPLRRLRDAAVELGHGNFEVVVDVSGGDERGDLARAFNAMASDVQRLVANVAEQKSRLEDIFESMTELLIVCGADGVITSANRSACVTLGFLERDLRGAKLDILLQSGSFKELRRRALLRPSSTNTPAAEVCLKTIDGRPIPSLVSATILSASTGSDPSTDAVLLVMQDQRERQKLESDLRQAQKLEAIGRLASGIAHEINTPVQFVANNLAFIADASRDLLAIAEKYRTLRDTAPRAMATLFHEASEMEAAMDYPYIVANMPEALASSTAGLDRIAGIASSIKRFAHPGQRGQTPIDLNAAVKSTITVARSEYKYVADVETDLGELPAIACFAGELNQVVLNLIVNAAHAIGDVVGGSDRRGRIVVRTRREEDTAVISISDTGGGIPEDVRDRIFDPFFTTKEVGKGTGQGLAIARSVVVEKHGGTLTFETERGKGTTFFIRIPIGGREDNVAAA